MRSSLFSIRWSVRCCAQTILSHVHGSFKQYFYENFFFFLTVQQALPLPVLWYRLRFWFPRWQLHSYFQQGQSPYCMEHPPKRYIAFEMYLHRLPPSCLKASLTLKSGALLVRRFCMSLLRLPQQNRLLNHLFQFVGIHAFYSRVIARIVKHLVNLLGAFVGGA